MDIKKFTGGRPRIAILDPNTLAVLGLKNILQTVMPIADIVSFVSFEEFFLHNPDSFFHFFVSQIIVLEQRSYFESQRTKTIVLTISRNPNSQLSGFHSFRINVSEELLVKDLLKIVQYGHSGGKNLPKFPNALTKNLLSDREIEVLSLVVQGLINKEIANKLCISLTTVISHRKNIVEKLGMKSVSALTIYAVMHGYVDINKI